MKVVALINHETEALGLFESEITKQGHRLQIILATQNPHEIKKVHDAQIVIIMGGPASVTDKANHLFIQNEIELVKHRIQQSLPTLGICLGAQIIAEAGGGHVYRGLQPERGWCKVTLTPSGIRDPLFKGCEAGFLSFHWHEDSFDHPKSAVHLAKTDAYPNQAFRMGKKCYGLQFHPEVSLLDIKEFTQKHKELIIQEKILECFMISPKEMAQHKLRAKKIIGNFLSLCLSK